MVKFCDKCGAELKNENVKFCDKCGAEVKLISSKQNNFNAQNIPGQSEEKSMAIAMLISFFLTGVGICYVGDVAKGLIIFVVSLIIIFFSNLIFRSWIVSLLGFVIWIFGLILTYQEVNKVNQQKRILLMNQLN